VDEAQQKKGILHRETEEFRHHIESTQKHNKFSRYTCGTRRH